MTRPMELDNLYQLSRRVLGTEYGVSFYALDVIGYPYPSKNYPIFEECQMSVRADSDDPQIACEFHLHL